MEILAVRVDTLNMSNVLVRVLKTIRRSCITIVFSSNQRYSTHDANYNVTLQLVILLVCLS